MSNIETINPATGEALKTYPLMSQSEVEAIIGSAHDAYQQWRKTDFTQRRELMNNLKNLLSARKEEFADFMTTEMGKPITQMKAEIDKCIFLCEHYIQQAENYLSPQSVQTEHKKSYVSYEPLGVVFAIMPWNFPLWQVMRFLVPNLMAGNGTVLRHADCVTGSGLLIEKLVRDAGYPTNIFRCVIIDHDMAATIIANPYIIGVTLTGSERAGRAVASEAGKALKKVALELGGSDPYLILADADLELAAELGVKFRFTACGQVCVSPKRFIIVKAVYEQFKALIAAKARRYIPGNPLEPNCILGPLARSDLRQQLHEQVQKSVQKGASLLVGGELPTGPGFFYPATVLSDVKADMPAYEDELFGPVITLIEADDEEHAIKLANSVRFGLGSGVFSRNIEKAEHIARYELQAGTSVVNGMTSSDPRMPFGGIKSSGFGRELSSYGIHEFVNIKSVFVE